MKKILIFALLAVLFTGIFFTACQGNDKPPLYGFISDAANHEIVNIDGRTNVIKIQGKDCSLNILRYPLIDYKDQMITINFSADVMRSGSDGDFNVLVNNLPDNPIITNIENAMSGVWYNMSGTLTVVPFNPVPIIFLDAFYKREADFYINNINLSIENITVKNPGENNSDGTRNLYVSASKGSINGNGTQSNPFQTINLAINYVKPGDTVFVDSDIYHERISIPSGEEGKPVTLTAMPGAEVIITPTIPINPQWRQHDGNIWVADISEYVKNMNTEFPQLFADRDSMVEARWPNMGSSMSTIMDYQRDVAQRGTNSNTVVASRNFPSDIAGARLVIWPGTESMSAWHTFVSPVKSVNGRTINLAIDAPIYLYNYHGGDNCSDTPNPGNPFYITGALALLDAPGEYYFDKETNLLYFYPPWNGRPDTRTLSVRHINSVAIYAENTSFVNVRNIKMYGGSIFMKNVRNNTIENCRFTYAENSQESGFDIPYGRRYDELGAMVVTGSNNRVSGCEFGFTSGAGIVMGGEDNIFTNNIIHNVDYAANYQRGALSIMESKRMEISYNSFLNSAGHHIRFTHYWYSNREFPPYVIHERNIIRNNYFENHGILNSDNGAFYTFGTDGGGTEIYNNFVVVGNKGDNGTQKKLRFGLYTDNYATNYIIHHNIIIGSGATGSGIGLIMNLPAEGMQFYNNTVIGFEYGFNFYGMEFDLHQRPIINEKISGNTASNNLLVNIRNRDYIYYAVENGRHVFQEGNFINGTIPLAVRPEGRDFFW